MTDGDPTAITLFGVPAKLVLELPDGPHDVSHLLQVRVREDDRPSGTGWWLDSDTLLRELDIERRARARAKNRAVHE